MASGKISLVKTGSSGAALVPPWALVIIAVISVQAGAAVAKQLFEAAGPSGVVFLRTLLGGAIFALLWRPRVLGHSRRAYLYMLVYGVDIALMMLSFYAAIDRIPLGIAVAIAFAGPLGLAVLGSRRAIDMVWVALAAAGVLLLSPFTAESLDPVGVLLAAADGVLWAGYIVISKRINRVLDGNTVLPLSMLIAALVALPVGIRGASAVLADPALILISLVVALLSSAVPFGLEFYALKRMQPRAFGLLLSLEPVAAAFMGFVLLHEALGLTEIVGISLVTVAAFATARSAG